MAEVQSVGARGRTLTMLLFHCFPGFLSNSRRVNGSVGPGIHERVGLLMLESILRDGLMLTPSEIMIDRPAVGKLLEPLKSPLRIPMGQVRACFTLDRLERVFAVQDRDRDLEDDEDAVSGAHAALFGEFGIGLDPIEARALGIVPTMYYYTRDDSGRVEDSVPGGTLNRLYEIRQVLAALATLEAIHREKLQHPEHLLSLADIQSIGIKLFDEVDRYARLNAMPAKTAQLLFDALPDINVPMWNLFQNIDFLFSMYEPADSRSSEAGTRFRPLAYFQQREWRIVLQQHEGLSLVSLDREGQPPSPSEWEEAMRDRSRRNVANTLREIRRVLGNQSALPCRGAWLLQAYGGRHFRDFISTIVVPAAARDEAEGLVEAYFEAGKRPQLIQCGAT